MIINKTKNKPYDRMTSFSSKSIVFIINSAFPNYVGGRETWLKNVATGLASRGWAVHIVSFAEYDMQQGQIKIHSARIPRLMKSLLRRGFLLLTGLYLRKGLKKILKNNKTKPIVVTLDTVICPIAMYGMKGKAVFVCANKGPHAEILSERYPEAQNIFHWLELHAYKVADEIWANGYDMKKMIEIQGYPAVMIGNGMNWEKAGCEQSRPEEYDENSLIVASIGTLLPIKGVEEAIKAFSSLKDSFNANLFFVGKGSQTKYINLAKAISVSDKVFFLGNREDVLPYMKNADVVLCLSGGGGMSMSALESMATNCIVIAWNTPVYSQLIKNGENGILVPYKNEIELTKAIRKVLEMQDFEKQRIGLNARKSVKCYSWGNILDKIEQRLLVLGAE